MPYGFRRKPRPDVKIDVLCRANEHPVPVPPRLPEKEPVPEPFQGGDVAGLLRRVLDKEIDVDDGFGRQARHPCRPDVFNTDDLAAQGLVERRAGSGESIRPSRVVVLDDDGLPRSRGLPCQGGSHLLGGAMEALCDFLRILSQLDLRKKQSLPAYNS